MQKWQYGELGKKRKKVDHEALQSPFNRIPGMNTDSVRDLLDIGLLDVDELRGRSPEALYEEIKAIKPKTPSDRLAYLRMCVYYAETENPDPQLLEAWKWSHSSF